jgi:micrococcal nuclease
MGFFVPLLGAHPIVSIVAVGALGAGVATTTALAVGGPPERAEVVRVVDGDTIEVDRGGALVTVRLLNVDTPETKDPDQPVQCLGPEATEYLMGLLPAGTSVELEYDRVRQDGYGRDLAGVRRAGLLVNGEIARAGLGIAKVFDGNDRFYPEVAQAQREAVDRRVGLYSPDTACTLPAQVASLSSRAESTATAEPGTDLAAIDAQQQQTDLLLAEAAALAALIRDDPARFPLAAVPGDLAEEWTEVVDAAQMRLAEAASANRAARTAEVERRARAAAEAAAAQRRAAAQAADAQQHAQRQARQDSGAARAGSSTPAPDRPAPLAPPRAGFVPPAGWTTDALTPGYAGCRQGYPGGRINGVYVWKPITC